MSLWTKSYDVTIQMNPACTFSWCYLFVNNENWKFGRNLPLGTFGIERVKHAKYYVNTSPTMLYDIFLVKGGNIRVLLLT